MQTKLQISQRPFTFQSLKIHTMEVCKFLSLALALSVCVHEAIQRIRERQNERILARSEASSTGFLTK